MTEKALLVVFTDSVPGREDEYNDWYTNVHLKDVVALEGFQGATRYQFAAPHPAEGPDPEFGYLAIYEVDADRVEEARAALAAAGPEREEALREGRRPLVPISDALGARRSFWYRQISPRVAPEDG